MLLADPTLAVRGWQPSSIQAPAKLRHIRRDCGWARGSELAGRGEEEARTAKAPRRDLWTARFRRARGHQAYGGRVGTWRATESTCIGAASFVVYPASTRLQRTLS